MRQSTKFLLSITLFATIFVLVSADVKTESLAVHSKYRTALGIPKLVWNATLATRAQNWANTMAKNQKFAHSTGRVNIGENIAYGTVKGNNATKFAEMWAAERQDFVAGVKYPNCTSTGDRADVWHYTQMIWKNTTQIGCGMGNYNGKLYYVCNYYPSGNYLNRFVY